jgi:hypothetical protein
MQAAPFYVALWTKQSGA